MPVSLRTWTAKPPYLYQTFRAKFIAALAPACRFCVNVAALTDMRVANFNRNVVEYAHFAVSLKLTDRVQYCTVNLT